MSEKQPGSETPAGQGENPDFSLASSNALIPLLIISALTVFVIFVAIINASPAVPPVGAIANRPHSPSEFPEVFGKDTALEGIENVAADVDNAANFAVPKPPFSDGIFPCSQCHDAIPPNPERRKLEGMHGDINFDHDAEHRWCLDCHDADNRDQLRLASGKHVSFTESYKLCGQCHGDKYRDWKLGVHGKRTGYWNGAKRYLLCVHCHNPHSPRFAALKPLPPPVRPQFLRTEDADRFDEHRLREGGPLWKERKEAEHESADGTGSPGA